MPLNAVDQAFHDTYTQLLAEGNLKASRTGVDTLMLPAMSMKFDLTRGRNPWPSTKELRSQKLGEEMEWFISGESSIKFLRDRKNGIWDDWFIPGTAVYDEPMILNLTVQQRIILAGKTLEIRQGIAKAIELRLAVSGIGGNAELKVLVEQGAIKTFTNLATHADLPAIGKYLDSIDAPRTVEFWPGIEGDTLTTQERIEAAVKLRLIHVMLPFFGTRTPDRDDRIYETAGFKPTWNVDFQLTADEERELNVALNGAGVPRRGNLPKRVSLAKRLSRVSKNNSQAWKKIVAATVRDPNVDWDGSVENVQVFHDNKFVKMQLDYGQQIQVTAVLNELEIPAWPLLDADIGPGGYGPAWRKWKDTQLIEAMDYGLVKAYEAQGYTNLGAPTRNYDLVVMTREIDQLADCIAKLRTNPDDRRMLVTAWNPGLIWRAALPPCHLYFQFMTAYRSGSEVFDDLKVKGKCWNDFTAVYFQYSQNLLGPEAFIEKFDNDVVFREYTEAMLNMDEFRVPTRHLHCLLVMRSSDTPLGTPFNVAQYALLVHVIAHITNMEAASLTWVGGDSHIYVNQIDAIKEQLSRESAEACDVRIHFEPGIKEIDDFTLDKVSFTGYEHRGFINIPVAV